MKAGVSRGKNRKTQHEVQLTKEIKSGKYEFTRKSKKSLGLLLHRTVQLLTYDAKKTSLS